MSKVGDLYIEAHDDLIAKYLKDNPNDTEEEAYEATADAVDQEVQDRVEANADAAHEAMKDRRRKND